MFQQMTACISFPAPHRRCCCEHSSLRHVDVQDGWAQPAALGHEFTLYLLRNPDARERVAKSGAKSAKNWPSSPSAASKTFAPHGVSRC